MTLDQAIDDVAASYAARGYSVVTRPRSDELPDFARDYSIQILARRGNAGALVAVKRSREEFAADPQMGRYAEETTRHSGWRFDLVLLESSTHGADTELSEPQEMSDEELHDRIAGVHRLKRDGELSLAYLAAWTIMEAAMRRAGAMLRSPNGQVAMPRQLLNEMLSQGALSLAEYESLEVALKRRNELVHGFASSNLSISDLDFLLNLAKRILAEAGTTAAS